MEPAILSIGTATPTLCASQEESSAWFAASFRNNPRAARIIKMLHRYSGIQTRYTCNDHYHSPPEQSRFAPGVSPEESATTAERMLIYERESVPLGISAAEAAVTRYAHQTGVNLQEVKDSITHIIAVSCTGFFAPGLDFMLVQKLGLSPNVQRTLIGFMGCAALFNGLRAAYNIVSHQPEAKVLVVSVELCSLHAQPSDEPDSLIGVSIFADGSSACIVGSPETEGCFQLEAFYTGISTDTEQEMAWRVGDHGFELRLSTSIPDLVSQSAPVGLNNLFGTSRPEFWAIHPGGKSILDRLQNVFELSDDDMWSSRQVLCNYGNMSSATILFVLDQLQTTLMSQSTGVAMAFGPGVTTEMIRLTYV